MTETMETTQCQICGSTLDITELDRMRKYVCEDCRMRNPMYLPTLQTAPIAWR